MSMQYDPKDVKELNKKLSNKEKYERARNDDNLTMCEGCGRLFESHLKGLWSESVCSEECRNYLEGEMR